MYSRSNRNAVGALDGRGLVAVIKRQVPLAGQLDHQLAWGQGWGWVTLPNGVWSGREFLIFFFVGNSSSSSNSHFRGSCTPVGLELGFFLNPHWAGSHCGGRRQNPHIEGSLCRAVDIFWLK